jgi:hypothetical protein
MPTDGRPLLASLVRIDAGQKVAERAAAPGDQIAAAAGGRRTAVMNAYVDGPG